MLEILSGDPAAAARRLASARGLGWSAPEHPGPDAFVLFGLLLGAPPLEIATGRLSAALSALAALDSDLDDEADPPLAVPPASELLGRAGVGPVTDPATQQTLVRAMQRAAERRLAAVVDEKRRRRYGSAAELVAAVVACAPGPATRSWAVGLRDTYRRYPALCRALEQHGVGTRSDGAGRSA